MTTSKSTKRTPMKKPARKVMKAPKRATAVKETTAEATTAGALPLGANGVPQGIFAAGDAAVGMGSLKKGFGRTPEDDRLFALGWPHLVYLVPGDATAKQLADPKKFSASHPYSPGEITVGAAPRMLRFLMTHGDEAAEKKAIQDPAPLSDAEAVKIARFAITEYAGKMVVYLLEALRGSAWTLDHVVAAFESVAPKWTKTDSLEAFGDGALTALHWVMLRVTAAEAAAARKRLAAVAKAVKKPGYDRAHQRLREVLDPASASPDDVWDLSFRAPKDVGKRALAELTSIERGDAPEPDARLAFLGGPAIVDAYVDNAGRFNREQRATLVSQLGRIAHPRIPELMEAVGNGEAKRWLAAYSASGK